MKIIYVHHGARQIGNPPTQNDDMSELGYKDCELTSQLIADGRLANSIKCIYTSPYFRCRKTAEIINERLKTTIINDDRLNEFVDNNESWIDCQKRLINFIEETIDKHNNDDAILCVTSGVNIGAFIIKAFGLSPSENTPFLSITSCSPIMFNFEKQ